MCGVNLQKTFNSFSSHFVYIEYQSKNILKQDTTFKINLNSSYGICGGLIQAPIYTFSSTKNGTQYVNNVECIWNIQTSNGFHIGLEFGDRFFLEKSDNCTKDYVEVFDKQTSGWISMGRVCGRDKPRPFNSSGSEMKVIFRTDGENTGSGFAIRWRENCGGNFTATNLPQYITSPKYPAKYPRNSFCNYTISAPPSIESNIVVNFTDFDLEDMSNGCTFDNMTVYKSSLYSVQKTLEYEGIYCGNKPALFFRSKYMMSLVFYSDFLLEKKGFKFEYSLENCGGNITNQTSIASPISPITGTYHDSLVCTWNVTAPANKKIVIRFNTFDLEKNSGCYLDNVALYEGHAIDLSQRKALICGNLTNFPPVIKIQQNKAIVQFVSDFSNQAKGFSATVMFLDKCDTTIALTSQNRSYNLNRVSTGYEGGLDCDTAVSVPDGYVISLTFDKFHLALCDSGNGSACSCDFVEIRDGFGPFSELFGTYCGHSIPNRIVSSSSALWIRFVTGK